MSLFPPRRRIFLMRHGEVNYFENGKPVPTPEARLNDDGREQAQAAHDLLVNMSFDRVIATGLSRTMETAQIVLGKRDIAVELVPELQEILGGRLSHMSADDMRQTFLDSMTHNVSADSRFLNGEHFGTFYSRITMAFESLLKASDWRSMLIVAHGAVNRAILAHVLHAPIETMGHIEQDACCVNLIDIDDRGYAIVRLLNFTPYNHNKHEMELTTMERYFLKFPER